MFCRDRLHFGMASLVFAVWLGASAAGAESLGRFIYPLTPGPQRDAPNIVIDLSKAKGDADVELWAAEARRLCEEWYPLVCRFLATDDWDSPAEIRLEFKHDLKAPAATSGDTIHVSVNWIKRHPEDFGMVIHELVHVIQRYPDGGNKPGWLVEGIADYIRWWRYEPEAPRSPVAADASYRDGYRTTAAFLAWISAHYDKRLVRRLDRALRDGKYSNDIFEEMTGKSVDALWNEFTQK